MCQVQGTLQSFPTPAPRRMFLRSIKHVSSARNVNIPDPTPPPHPSIACHTPDDKKHLKQRDRHWRREQKQVTTSEQDVTDEACGAWQCMSLVLLCHLTSWGRKRHMRRTSSTCFYLATKTHYGMFLLPEITLPIPVRGRTSRALNNCCHAGTINTCTICASSMSCQCCQLMGHSCNNPIHIHQY